VNKTSNFSVGFSFLLYFLYSPGFFCIVYGFSEMGLLESREDAFEGK
jgi:hypothetical protein